MRVNIFTCFSQDTGLNSVVRRIDGTTDRFDYLRLFAHEKQAEVVGKGLPGFGIYTTLSHPVIGHHNGQLLSGTKVKLEDFGHHDGR